MSSLALQLQYVVLIELVGYWSAWQGKSTRTGRESTYDLAWVAAAGGPPGPGDRRVLELDARDERRNRARVRVTTCVRV